MQPHGQHRCNGCDFVLYTGFNASEGVAFAPADWLRFLEASAGRHRRFRQPSPVNHERLLLQASSQPISQRRSAPRLAARLESEIMMTNSC